MGRTRLNTRTKDLAEEDVSVSEGRVELSLTSDQLWMIYISLLRSIDSLTIEYGERHEALAEEIREICIEEFDWE